MHSYLLDTGFWIALYNPQKEPDRSAKVDIISTYIESENIIIPFPTMYEFLNTRFSRRSYAEQFMKLISRPNFVKVYDNSYREKAFQNCLNNMQYLKQDSSLVDEVIKQIIDLRSIKIDYLISFDITLNNYARSRGIETYL